MVVRPTSWRRLRIFIRENTNLVSIASAVLVGVLAATASIHTSNRNLHDQRELHERSAAAQRAAQGAEHKEQRLAEARTIRATIYADYLTTVNGFIAHLLSDQYESCLARVPSSVGSYGAYGFHATPPCRVVAAADLKHSESMQLSQIGLQAHGTQAARALLKKFQALHSGRQNAIIGDVTGRAGARRTLLDNHSSLQSYDAVFIAQMCLDVNPLPDDDC